MVRRGDNFYGGTPLRNSNDISESLTDCYVERHDLLETPMIEVNIIVVLLIYRF